MAASDWLLLAQAWWVLLYFRVALQRSSFERVERKFKLAEVKKVQASESVEFARRLFRLIYLASRLHPWKMYCLTRACTLQWMLGIRGIESQLHIGMNKTQDGIYAHAWVEIMGQAIGEVDNITEKFSSLNPSN